MSHIETEGKKNIRKFLAPAIIGAFFCFLYVRFGVGEYPDSVTYMENYMDREPLYPLLLKLFKTVLGAGFYLKAVAMMQNLFAALATWYLYSYITRHFEMQAAARMLSMAVLLLPHLLTGVMSSSGIILTNAILSEGITLSLYQLFFTLLLKFLYEKKNRKYAAAALLTALLAVFARGQMMPMLLIWMVVCIGSELSGMRRNLRRHGKNGNPIREEVCVSPESRTRRGVMRIFGILLLTVLAFLIRAVGISGYNRLVYGYAQGNTGGNMTILTNVLYSAGPEDVRNLKGRFTQQERELLQAVYDEMQEKGYTYRDAGSGFENRILHHEDSHDKIKFEILYEQFDSFFEQEAGSEGILNGLSWQEWEENKSNGTLIRIRMDELAGRYMKAVLPACLGNWINTYFYVAAGGFIRTVAVLHPLLNPAAVFLYIVAIGLMCYLFKKGKVHDAPWMMALVLLMTAANVCATSMMIMCLSRYMIYNMSLFYLAGLVMLQELYRGIGKE